MPIRNSLLEKIIGVVAKPKTETKIQDGTLEFNLTDDQLQYVINQRLNLGDPTDIKRLFTEGPSTPKKP